MKIELTDTRPEQFTLEWPGQYDIFSHLEFAAGVPSVLCVLTTRKENGLPNACLHAWSTFSGDSGGFFAILSGLMQCTHTYKNILRDREFCVNFLSPAYYENCAKTIRHNDPETDEIAAGGFTAESARTVGAPRIKEAFLCYECTLDSVRDLSEKGQNALVIGRVRHAAVEEGHNQFSEICGENGFMFNVHSPKDPVTGAESRSAVARLEAVQFVD